MNKKLFKQLQSVIDYIEENILETIKITDLTNLVYMSKSSFYNVCSLVLGVPIKKYIRQRKLSHSAYDLIFSHKNILNIALKYGYSSSASYSRSFKQLYGLSPQHYKNFGKYYDAFPRIILINQNTGGKLMNCHIKNVAILNSVISNSAKGYLLDIDIDHFLNINKEFGSDIGDMVIVKVKKSLEEVLVKYSIKSKVIRIHGDEFAIVITDINTNHLEQLCKDMLIEVNKGLKHNIIFVPISISIGITSISNDDNIDLIDQAQSAMLAAKKAGKNQYKFVK
ncbi:diguanylate cyclase [Clostridium sp. 'deep sea']|uniref:diguanylate cyclase domain-containing protein n=1 Tax=Clostridium sp. 'deep sea' TaxID=2779445 RepID=UPI001896738E|nr:diguanylate cyclase [Clostridium sp. 'deep sea']QOR35416.1 diguanylate cyclase [Clostridium sp. 'deep sea']